MIHTYLRAPVVALVVGIFILTTLESNAANPNQNSSIGSNLSSVKSWSPAWTFVDIGPRLRNWVSGGPKSYDVCNTSQSDSSLCQSGNELVTDKHGWPVRVASNTQGTVMPKSAMYDGVNGKYPSGEYLIFWEGSGRVRLTGSVTPAAVLTGTGTAAEPFRGVFTVPTSKTLPIQFIIEDIGASAGNTIRNIRILVPGGVRGTVTDSGQIINIDAFDFCTNLPKRSEGVSRLTAGRQCIDFEHVAYNRFRRKPDGSERSPAEAVQEGQIVFHPKMLAQLRNYRSLRYMDLMEINDSPVVTWDDRAKIRDQSFTTSAGVPPEYCIALSNIVHADPWFTMPHKANNDYNRQFARLVDEQLESGRKIYLEYSNETWNAVFSQNAWIMNQGTLRNLPGDRYQRGGRYHSERTVEIANLWKNTLGSRSSELKVVMGSQAFNPYVSELRMGWSNTASVVDYLAIAPYFARYFGDPSNAPITRNMNATSAFREINSGGVFDNSPEGGSLVDARQAVQRSGQIAQQHNVGLIAYEGGQHLAGYGGTQDNNQISNLFIQLNSDPRMGAAYRQYLQDWKDAGGEMFVHYIHISAWSKWGSWGALKNQVEDPQQSPKFQALMDFNTQHPCWWEDCSLDSGDVITGGTDGEDPDTINPDTEPDDETDNGDGENTDGASDGNTDSENGDNGDSTTDGENNGESGDSGESDGNADGGSDSGPPVTTDGGNNDESDSEGDNDGGSNTPVSGGNGQNDTDTEDPTGEQEPSGGDQDEPAPRVVEAPTRVVARGHKNLIKITWEPGDSKRMMLFTVYRSVDGKGFRPVARTRARGFADRDTKRRRIYRYAVTATSGGVESALSRPTSAVREGLRHRVARVKTSLSSRNRTLGLWDGKARVRVVNSRGRAVEGAKVWASWWRRSGKAEPVKLKTATLTTNHRGVVNILANDIKAQRGQSIRLRIDRVEYGKSVFDRRASDVGDWVSPN